jgi:hypothetical protein
LKTYKNSLTGPLSIADLEYGVMTNKYGVSVSFPRQLVIFGKTVDISILSENLDFFKTHKNSYTGPLGITNPEYGGHN